MADAAHAVLSSTEIELYGRQIAHHIDATIAFIEAQLRSQQ